MNFMIGILSGFFGGAVTTFIKRKIMDLTLVLVILSDQFYNDNLWNV